ncbi:YlqF/YawG family GTPase [Sulfobacillus harzensis]|uniref:Ribosome biogenesis GTPase A n=1 Tax=Sulfobacillus harzensis TaxID=2729629 RepID=A0A7Y0L894_9FIRM|nr:GTPase [Sulfobacillus harzensis]NMP24611.1 GTP-binding protein HSR1 [Sulfobacillus harzensis]
MSSRGWYPGHMLVTQKAIRELAPYLTAFIEVVDARAPELTRHRPLASWIGRTPLILVMNKSDVADPAVTAAWVSWYETQNITAVALTASSQDAKGKLKAAITKRLKPPYRLSVVGLPNLGKSTVLNRMVGKNRVRTGGKPGVTRGPQWIRLDDGWEWLDLPGVVTPSKSRDWRLALLGVVPLDPGDAELIASRVWQLYYPQADDEGWVEWGRSRGFLVKGGAVDRQRAADAVITGFRTASLGRLSLEQPGDAAP